MRVGSRQILFVGPRQILFVGPPQQFACGPTNDCEVLDHVQTRLYENAVIPVALAHSAASLPLGVGQSVLRALVQQSLGLPTRSQIRQTGPFAGSN